MQCERQRAEAWELVQGQCSEKRQGSRRQQLGLKDVSPPPLTQVRRRASLPWPSPSTVGLYGYNGNLVISPFLGCAQETLVEQASRDHLPFSEMGVILAFTPTRRLEVSVPFQTCSTPTRWSL